MTLIKAAEIPSATKVKRCCADVTGRPKKLHGKKKLLRDLTLLCG
jgi:hypothetical protein